MEKENQVCSLELSKKLKELGVKQESLFYWYKIPGDVFTLGDSSDVMNNGMEIGNSTAPQWEEYSAFTVAELGEVIGRRSLYKKAIDFLVLLFWKSL